MQGAFEDAIKVMMIALIALGAGGGCCASGAIVVFAKHMHWL